jgi:hypothetical protein
MAYDRSVELRRIAAVYRHDHRDRGAGGTRSSAPRRPCRAAGLAGRSPPGRSAPGP